MTNHDTRFHSLCQDLHTKVGNLKKILTNDSSLKHSNSRGFELRRTARSIQRLLQNSEFLTFFSSALQSPGVSYSIDLTNTSIETMQLKICEGVVSDLMSLVTMTTVLYNDANAFELLRLLQHTSLDLLHILPSFDPAWLEKVLNQILVLMQSSVLSQYDLLSKMVVLFNQHVSSQDELRVLFAKHDRSVFATTCVALNFMKSRQTEIPTTESIPIEFAIFVDSLVSFCTICSIEAAPTDTMDAECNTPTSLALRGESMDVSTPSHDYRGASYEWERRISDAKHCLQYAGRCSFLCRHPRFLWDSAS